MDAIFRARKAANAGSGGKIMRGRRVAAAASPYARPASSPPPPPPPENPNWLFGLVGPATRTIASGAGKLLSTFFGPDSSPSSSSESSTASSSEDGVDGDIFAQEDHNLNQTGTTLGANKCFDMPTVEKSETKAAIERLLLQETFSRDECDRLTQIIQSRVVECPDAKEWKDVGHNELQSDLQAMTSSVVHSYLDNGFDSLSPRSLDPGIYTPDFHNTAVMEAKKWLEEKKSEPISKLDQNVETFTPNPYVLPNAAEGEMGSPVLVAKSYMQARPPWASPSLKNIGFLSPSPIGMHLLKEGTPYPFGAHSFSSSKLLKRSSLLDSWDVLDGARRVCFKSGEDILRSDSCNHIGSSLLELEHKSSPTSSTHDKREAEVGAMTHDSSSLLDTRSIDASVHVPTDLAVNGGFPVHNGPRTEALSSAPSPLITDKTQDFEDAQHKGGAEFATFITHESIVPDNVSVQHDDLPDQPADVVNSEPHLKPLENIKSALQSDANISPGVEDISEFDLQKGSQLGEMVQVKSSFQPTKALGVKEMDSANGSRSPGGNSSSQNEVNRSREKVLANGFPASTSSLAAGLNVESGLRHSNEGDPNLLNTRDDKFVRGNPIQETCELLSEESVDIPLIEETEGVASGSHDSSSHSKEPFQIETKPVSSRGKVKRANTGVQKSHNSSSHSKEPFQIETKPVSSRGRVKRANTGVQKQQGNRVGKYSRRISGRGK